MTSHLTSTTPNSSCGFKLAVPILLILFCIPVCAQRRMSADVETKQVWQGKSVTTTKSVYCASNGRLVVVSHRPVEYTAVTGAKGESRIYFPKTNQVLVDNEGSFASGDDLLSIFFNGRADDLGLSLFGYRLKSTAMDEGYLRKTFVSPSRDNIPTVVIVYENYLPIYCEYLNAEGITVSKTYFSRYEQFQRFTMPCRMTSISYTSKGDSTVTRTIYSNVTVDGGDNWFDFEIPASAKTMTLKEAAKQLSSSIR